MRCRILVSLVVGSCLLGLASPFVAAGDRPARQVVELFQAREAGEIEIRLIPKDAKRATVIVRNMTDRPLSVRMPAAFAGVPVLAQIGGGVGAGQQGGFGVGQGGLGGGGGVQSFGGGLGGGLGGGGLGGFGGGGLGGGGLGGGGFFNVPPDATKKIRVATVCLEHGKNDPNPRINYKLVPIEEFTDNPHVAELCSMLGNGEIDQTSAQAAAWHILDGLTWEQLAQKVRVRHLDGSVEMYFSTEHMQRALRIVQETAVRAAARAKAGKQADYPSY